MLFRSIGMDENYHLLSDKEKRESVHMLRGLLDERVGLRRDAVRLTLRSLCCTVCPDFKNLSAEQKDAYSIAALQELFEKSVNYKTCMQLIKEKILSLLRFSDDAKEGLSALCGVCLSVFQVTAGRSSRFNMLQAVNAQVSICFCVNVLSLCRILESKGVATFMITYNVILGAAAFSLIYKYLGIPTLPLPFLPI